MQLSRIDLTYVTASFSSQRSPCSGSLSQAHAASNIPHPARDLVCHADTATSEQQILDVWWHETAVRYGVNMGWPYCAMVVFQNHCINEHPPRNDILQC